MKINTALNKTIVILIMALLSYPVFAQHGHHGGGGYNHGGYNHGSYNHGSNVDFGIWFGPAGPYYYSYGSPDYYYPTDRYVIVQPASAPSNGSTVVMRAQVELYDKGYYNGSIDGLAGPQTRSAVKSFQNNQHLAVTGNLDDATLKALGVKK